MEHTKLLKGRSWIRLATLTSCFNYAFNFEIITDMQISADSSVSNDLFLPWHGRRFPVWKNRAVFIKTGLVHLINPLGHVPTALGPGSGEFPARQQTCGPANTFASLCTQHTGASHSGLVDLCPRWEKRSQE